MLQIPLGTQIGYQLYTGYKGSVIANESVVIGGNCNLSQFTTIGSNEDKAAEIGDSVYIGSNVTIGAGSVVAKSILDNATDAGNYARVLKFNNPGRYVGNRYERGDRG
jgi:serine O-acetyltransferase